jgi:tyrosyl-tRNA synthetase
MIKQGAAKVNDVAVADQNAVLSAGDIMDGQVKLSAGKKRHALLKAV